MPSWAFRLQEDQEDYGVDGEIEITTADDKATGFIFKVQLKGTSIAKYDKSGQLVFSEASVERFTYYVSELRIPLIFVVCDVISGDCFWTQVQGNRQLESALSNAVAQRQQTFTIKFPASRKILKSAESAGEIVGGVEAGSDTITLRALQAISPASVREHIGREPDIEAAEKQFRVFAGIAALESIRKMVQSGDCDAAAKKGRDLLEAESESSEVRIFGGLALARAYDISLRLRRVPGAGLEAAKLKLGVASRMLEVSRQAGCETRIRRYVRIFTRAARMQINGRAAMALAFSENAQKLQGETMAGPITRLQRVEVSALVSKDFFKLCRALYRLGSGGFFSVMPYALLDITESAFPFVSSLRILGRGDLANAYINALFDFLPFCVGIVRRFNSESEIAEILTGLGIALLALAAGDPSSMPALIKRYEEALKGEPAFRCLDEVLCDLRKRVEQVQARSGANAKPSMSELREYYAQQAAELGINLNDPNDGIAKVVRIGLDDLDPTRVAKNCRHIHVMTTSHGIPAEMLGLPTAGSKRTVCLKHGHSIENLSLDAAYEFFAKEFPWTRGQICCENCPDKAPHPDGWEWSEEWNSQQHARYQELVKRDDPKG